MKIFQLAPLLSAVLAVPKKPSEASFTPLAWGEAWGEGDQDKIMAYFDDDATMWDKDGETVTKDDIEEHMTDMVRFKPSKGEYLTVAPFAPTSFLWPNSTEEGEFFTASEEFDNFKDGCWKYGWALEWTGDKGDDAGGISLIELDDDDKIIQQLVIDLKEKNNDDDDNDESDKKDKKNSKKDKKKKKKDKKKDKKKKKKGKSDSGDELENIVGIKPILATASRTFNAKKPDVWAKMFSDDTEVKLWVDGKKSECSGEECLQFWKDHWIDHDRITWTFLTPSVKGFVASWIVAPSDSTKNDDDKQDEKSGSKGYTADKMILNGKEMKTSVKGKNEAPPTYDYAGFGVGVWELDQDGAVKALRMYTNFHEDDEHPDGKAGWPDCLHA